MDRVVDDFETAKITTEKYDTDALSIVAIGASAGGLEALTEMLSQAPQGVPAAFVVVQHLAPDQKSVLHEMLQKNCALPVTQITPNETIKAGRVYVVPPGQVVDFKDGTLDLTKREPAQRNFRTIDHFFTSIAKNVGRNAYCVVLSGTGSDGSEGLRRIKAAGGFAVAQEAESALFPGMPDAAVATGVVDDILPAREIIPRLIDVIQNRNVVDSGVTHKNLLADINRVMPEMLAQLRGVTGHDFYDYKPGTIIRRIERRMTSLKVPDADAFARIIRDDENEAHLLAQDFLIGVTAFFRDAEAFEALREKVIEPLVATNSSNIRVWVPGCSTGEEVYTIAMLLHEALEKREQRCSLQVFGTDIDSQALTAARSGFYSHTAMEKLDAERRRKFFVPEGGGFRAAPVLREICIFAPHNLVQDPPFSRMDLVSCRNVMIYLSSHLQARVLPRFHFSLKRDGALFLGPSEGLASQEEMFHTLDRSHRIFKRNNAVVAHYSSLSDALPRAGRTRSPTLSPDPADTQSFEAMAERAFLAQHSTPYAVISGAGKVKFISPAMVEFARPAAGTPSTLIENYLTPELCGPVHRALADAKESKCEQKFADVLVAKTPDKPKMYDFKLSPMEKAAGCFLLVLTEVRATDTASISDTDRDILVGVDGDLHRQSTEVARVFEATGQELKGNDDGLMRMNEELQSSNEELQTSREELQSINEELETVNAELRENNRRLTRANSDLKNLFESTDIAVLFLNRNFTVRSFTPATTQLYGLRDRDIGRPISDVSSRIDYPDLKHDAEQVDRTLQPLEREVQIAGTDETFILRISPYRTTDDRMDGYVVSFIDITQRKRNEEVLERNRHELAEQYAELESLYDTTPVGLSLVDRDMRWIRINQMLADINGFSIEEHVGSKLRDLLPDLIDEVEAAYQYVFDTGKANLGNAIEAALPSDPDRKRHFIADFYPIRVDGELRAVGTCVTEVTEQKRLMAQVVESERRLNELLDSSPMIVAITEGPDHIFTYSNPLNDAFCGHRELIGKPLKEAMPEAERQGILAMLDQVYKTGKPIRIEEFKVDIDRHGDGNREDAWFSQSHEPLLDENGKTRGVASFSFEITPAIVSRRRAQKSEHQKTLLLGELQHRVKNTLATIRAMSKLLVPGAEDAKQYQLRLSTRLMSMSRTHDLMFGDGNISTSILALAQVEAAPYNDTGTPRVVTSGGDFVIRSDEAPMLGMALHELMTNAAKYGALSSKDGVVTIVAQEDAESGVRSLVWNESGGPRVKKPADKGGFGSIILEEVLKTNLQAEVEKQFRAAGLYVVVNLKPLRERE